MSKTFSRISAATAMSIAAGQAEVKLSAVKNVDLNTDPDGLYYITFQGDWMNYTCYIDYVTGEIRGFFSEPLDLYKE